MTAPLQDVGGDLAATIASFEDELSHAELRHWTAVAKLDGARLETVSDALADLHERRRLAARTEELARERALLDRLSADRAAPALGTVFHALAHAAAATTDLEGL